MKDVFLLKLLIYILLFVEAGLLFRVYQKDNWQREIMQTVLPSFTRVEAREDIVIHSANPNNKEFYDEAYNDKSIEKTIFPSEKVFGGVVPHHLFVKWDIARYFHGLKNENYKTVVIIAPNHFDLGNENIITSEATWVTPYGEILPASGVIKKITSDNVVKVSEAPFEKEHSIAGLVSFVKKSFPEARFVPILLKGNTSEEQMQLFIEELQDTIDIENTLVLASVDFSHYQKVAVADFHDDITQSLISSFDTNRVLQTEVDSPQSLFVLLRYLEKMNIRKSQLVYSTNSSRLANLPDEPSTSHQFWYFFQGEQEKSNSMSFLFLGDIMLDRNVGALIKKNGLGSLLDTLAGEEKRFFSGMDVISANLESAVTNGGEHYRPIAVNDFAVHPDIVKELQEQYNFNYFTIANNHLWDQGTVGVTETENNLKELGLSFSGCIDSALGDCSSTVMNIGEKKVGFVAMSMVYHDFDLEQAKAIVEGLKATTDYIVVNIHWGKEYEHQFNKKQQSIAYALIDSGADVIIGHHPHVVQGMEVYNNKPIFYSLGNFIFDQYFSSDTQEGVSLGYAVKDTTLSISLFPLRSVKSQALLMTEKEKEVFLEKFIQWSQVDGNIKEQIRNGVITLPL